MDITELIIADHDDAAALFAEIENVAADDARTSQAMRLVARLAVCLKTHTRAEERVLYDALRTGPPELAAYALEAAYEHQTLEMMIDKLVVHRPGPELRAILKVGQWLFSQHARQHEEAQILPAVRAHLSADELAHLAHDYLAEKRRIEPQISRLVGAPYRGTEGRTLHVHNHRR